MSGDISSRILREKINIQRAAYGDDLVLEQLTPGEQATALVIEAELQALRARLFQLENRGDCA